VNLESILTAIQGYGAQEAEVFRVDSCTKIVVFENNTLKSLHSASETTYRLRAIIENRMGCYTTNNEKLLLPCCHKVVEMAKASTPDPYAILPAGQPIKPVENLYDETEVKLTEVLKNGYRLVETFRKYDTRLSVDSAMLQVSWHHLNIVNSRGVKAQESRSCSRYFLMGLAAENTNVSSFDYRINAAVSWSKIVEKIEEDALSLARDICQSLAARTIPSFTGYLLLSPETVSDFISALEYLLYARNVQEKRSAFAGKINQPVASFSLTLSDEPLRPGLPWSASFDSEGVPTRSLTVIEKGVLLSYLYDTYAAARENASSTGHAGGKMYSPVLKPNSSLKEMYRNISRGLLVRRFSGNISPVNGVVSGVAKGGWYIENGQLLHPVSQTMITGNFFQMLKNIVAVSEETEPTFSGYLPYLQINDVDILGFQEKP